MEPARAAATRRPTRKRSRKKPRLRHEQRASPEPSQHGKNRARAAGGTRAVPSSHYSPLLPYLMERPRTRRRSARDKRANKRSRSKIGAILQRSTRSPSLRFLFHFSRVIHVHALRRKKKGCVPREGHARADDRKEIFDLGLSGFMRQDPFFIPHLETDRSGRNNPHAHAHAHSLLCVTTTGTRTDSVASVSVQVDPFTSGIRDPGGEGGGGYCSA